MDNEWEDIPSNDGEWEDLPLPKSMLQSAGDAVNDFATNLSNNWIGRGAAEIASYPGAAMQTLGTDKPFEEARQQLLAQDQAQYTQAAQRSPVASGIGTFAGNVASGPQGGASVLGRAGIDAGIGAADAASQGGDLGDIAKNAATAGVLSGATGGALKGLRAGAGMLGQGIESSTNFVRGQALPEATFAASGGNLAKQGSGLIKTATDAATTYLGPAARLGTKVISGSADQVSSILKQAPQTLGKWAAPLQAAAARGSLNTSIFLLQKTDPEFRQHMESLNESP